METKVEIIMCLGCPPGLTLNKGTRPRDAWFTNQQEP